MKFIDLAFAIASALALHLAAATPQESFTQANQRLAAGDYAGAAAAYAALGKQGVSAALENNRGLAHLDAHQLGSAVTHLRIASRLAPGDPEILANLKLARAAAGRLASAGEEPWERLLDSFRLNQWAGAALLTAWLWLGLWVATRASPRFRAAFGKLNWAAAFVAVSFATALEAAAHRRADDPDVVVSDAGATVRLSPFEEAKQVFAAIPGQELKKKEQQGDWCLIEETGGGRYGWIRADQINTIPCL